MIKINSFEIDVDNLKDSHLRVLSSSISSNFYKLKIESELIDKGKYIVHLYEDIYDNEKDTHSKELIITDNLIYSRNTDSILLKTKINVDLKSLSIFNFIKNKCPHLYEFIKDNDINNIDIDCRIIEYVYSSAIEFFNTINSGCLNYINFITLLYICEHFYTNNSFDKNVLTIKNPREFHKKIYRIESLYDVVDNYSSVKLFNQNKNNWSVYTYKDYYSYEFNDNKIAKIGDFLTLDKNKDLILLTLVTYKADQQNQRRY